MLLIKNGRLLEPPSKTDALVNVLIDGERISKVGPSLAAPNAETFDASGLIVAPGLLTCIATSESRVRRFPRL